jgi:predicted RNA-binding Zn ribbon-like protein
VFTFVSRRPSLDLTATLTFRHRDQPIELLVEPSDVTRWARAAGLVDHDMAVGDDGLARTKALREAIYAVAAERTRHGAGVDLLNSAAQAPPLGLTLDHCGLRRHGDLGQLLSTLARDALELVGGDLVSQVKECAGEDCSRLYLDTSRNGTRRWCGMNQCGDRVKAANYRARRRTLAQG